MIALNKGNSDCLSALNEFIPIGMGEIESFRLMSRIETKFVASATTFNSLIKTLASRYRILERSHTRIFPYTTTYFDTSDYLFYNQHIRGQLNRHKIRYRKYEYTGESFLEIKKKTNKGRTDKWRIPNDFSSGRFDEDANMLLTQHLPVSSLLIRPVLVSNFSRITLINTDLKERITFDYDISFNDLKNGSKINLPYLTIAELKKDVYNHTGPFIGTIRKMNIHPTSFSKYCMGVALLNTSVKKNTLKPKLLSLKRIENEYFGFSGR